MLVFFGGGELLGGGLGFRGAFLAAGTLFGDFDGLIEEVEGFVLAFGGAGGAAGVCLFCGVGVSGVSDRKSVV